MGAKDTDDDFTQRFNTCTSPKDVLALAEAHNLSVDDVASRLHASSQADADLLGACLGHHHDFWQRFAGRFACHFDEFGGLDLVTALRRYLWRFRLPGEAAPIGRILEGFAAGFMTANPPPEAAAGSTTRPTSHGLPGGIEPSARGWRTNQPRTAKPCCIACGALERDDAPLRTCTGCGVVSFCPRCCRSAGSYGHAIRGCIGFGRACEAAARENGRLSSGRITYASPVVRGVCESAYVGEVDKGERWVRASPIKSPDAAFVLSYAIVMLSTNLHNPSVKKADKMATHQFLAQLREQNDGVAFPGDYVEAVYNAIQEEELKVRTV